MRLMHLRTIDTEYNRMARFNVPFDLAVHITERPMEKSDHLYGEWVLLALQQQEADQPNAVDEPLLAAARDAWPHVLAHARRKLSEKGLLSDSTVFAAEVWEKVLRAVSKKRQRRPEHQLEIANLESYLIGIFHHRFNRLLEREQRWLSTIELVASTADLEKIESARNIRWVSELERAITIKQIVAHMDEWTRNVWKARQYGYSWKEISKPLGLNVQQAIMRYRYGLEKTRKRLIELLRARKASPPADR